MKASVVMCLAVALVTCAKAQPARRRQQFQPYWPNYNQQRQQWNPNFWGQGQDGGDQQEANEQQLEEQENAYERQQEMQEQEQEMREQQEQEQPEQAEAGDGQWYGQWNQQQWSSYQQWPSYQQQPNYQQQRPGYNQEAMELQEQGEQQEAMDLRDRDLQEAMDLRDAQEPQEQTAAGGDTSEESNEEVESESFSSPSNSQLSVGPFGSI